MSKPVTISQRPPTDRHGNEHTRPSSTPYTPGEGSATEVQSPSGVPCSQSSTWSIAPLAADAAELAPRA